LRPRVKEGFLERGNEPPPRKLEVWRSGVSSPNGVRGGAP